MKRLGEYIAAFQLARRSFVAITVIVLGFTLSYVWPVLFPLSLSLLLLLISLLVVDVFLLFFNSAGISASRKLPSLLGLGDVEQVVLTVSSSYPHSVSLQIYDELPFVFQQRDFEMAQSIKADEELKLKYEVTPTERGEYRWGHTSIIARTSIALVARKFNAAKPDSAACYPSILQMKNFELMAFARVANFQGIKKVRRLGHSYEFEQIKQYVQGDEVRTVNWKATSRRHQLMVNQYTDERSQQVYCLLDKSRSMHMPFDGMSLLDYSINTALVISNIALKKHDRSGLISFSNKLGKIIKAERSRNQLKKILNNLYNEKPREQEADFNLLYHSIKRSINHRSLLFLFSNFESTYAMERALPVLRKMNAQHLLVVIIFKNQELENFAHKDAEIVKDIYSQTLAQKLVDEKENMAQLLRRYGIQTILTRPQELSLNAVNKYLELKSRGLI